LEQAYVKRFFDFFNGELVAPPEVTCQQQKMKINTHLDKKSHATALLNYNSLF